MTPFQKLDKSLFIFRFKIECKAIEILKKYSVILMQEESSVPYVSIMLLSRNV